MTDAPAVTYPVGRARPLALLLAGLWLAGALLTLALWWMPRAPLGGLAGGLLVGSLVATGAALLGFWRSQSARRLIWNGACWGLREGAIESAGDEVRVEVRLDAQRALLLRYRDPHRARPLWLWAQASSDAGRWHLLRCALYSSGKSAVRTAPAAAAEQRA